MFHHEHNLDPGFVPGRKAMMVVSLILFGLGVGEIAAGAIISNDSGGYYIGGWYVGVICVIAALRGFYLPNIYSVVWLSVLSFISFVTSIVGAGLQSAYYNFLNEMEACASYDDNKSSGSCGYTDYSHFTCYGDNDYYLYAAACSADYVIDNDYDDYSDVCSCVKEDDDNDCYNFTNIDDCNNIIDKLPNDLKSAYIVAIFCGLASVLLLVLSCISVNSPKCLANKKAYNDALLLNEHGVTNTTADVVRPSTTEAGYVVGADDVVVVPSHEVTNPVATSY